jgi:hypothetical protein
MGMLEQKQEYAALIESDKRPFVDEKGPARLPLEIQHSSFCCSPGNYIVQQ